MKRFTAAADNYSVTRDFYIGTLEERDGLATVLRYAADSPKPKQAMNVIYLLDDGRSVVPYYVAGWVGAEDEAVDALFLKPFPTAAEGQVRPDNGRPVDFSLWMQGPKTALHLKVTTG